MTILGQGGNNRNITQEYNVLLEEIEQYNQKVTEEYSEKINLSTTNPMLVLEEYLTNKYILERNLIPQLNQTFTRFKDNQRTIKLGYIIILETINKDNIDLLKSIFEPEEILDIYLLNCDTPCVDIYNYVKELDLYIKNGQAIIQDYFKDYAIQEEKISIFKIVKKEYNKGYLTINDNWTGKKPYRIEFMGIIHEVNSFKDVFRVVNTQLYEVNNENYKKVVNHARMSPYKYWDKSPLNLMTPYQVAEDIYIETHGEANRFRKLITVLFKIEELEVETLKVYIK